MEQVTAGESMPRPYGEQQKGNLRVSSLNRYQKTHTKNAGGFMPCVFCYFRIMSFTFIKRVVEARSCSESFMVILLIAASNCGINTCSSALTRLLVRSISPASNSTARSMLASFTIIESTSEKMPRLVSSSLDVLARPCLLYTSDAADE